jgi:hypothetical protein
LKLAKKAAGIPESDDVKIVVYPRPKTWLESVIERRGPDNSDREAMGQTLARVLQVVQPVARQLDAVGIKTQRADQDNTLRMSPELTNH